MKLSAILAQTGLAARLICDGEFQTLEQCTKIRKQNALTYLENSAYIDALSNRDISCVICTSELLCDIPKHITGIAVADSPKLAFFNIQKAMLQSREKWPSRIDPSARISDGAYIAPYNVVIGKNVEIQPMVMIHENTTIRDHVRICSGTVVGGQSFTSLRDGEKMFLAQDAGSTFIDEGVEICSNCHIACGTLENDVTILGAYAKLDAMVYIGHGAVVGKRVLLPVASIIAGNCVIGDDVWIGPNAIVSNRVEVGNRARVSLGSVVTKDVPAGATVTGNFAIPHQQFLKNLKESIKETEE